VTCLFVVQRLLKETGMSVRMFTKSITDSHGMCFYQICNNMYSIKNPRSTIDSVGMF
jgi:hypothetical protein